MFGTIDWGNLAKASTATLLTVLLSLNPIATHPAIAAFGRKSPAKTETAQPSKLSGKLTEVAPPAAIQELRQAFDNNQPQVAIVSPKPNTVLDDDTVSVQFQVRDLTLFKNQDLGLGPHLHVFLDNQPYQAVYDPGKPLVLEKLTPGTHTIRAFASRPWHESFKNEGAYAQTTFHVFTKTSENSPTANLPLLTYSRPQAAYGAEPIMLDFYLTNAPLHLVAKTDNQDDIADWRIRCTVNGSSFVLDQWQPVWLKGFKPGKNWVQLEFLDENGNPVKNAFNNTARVITYEPGGKDTLAKLVRGDLSVAIARGMVDADYKPPVPAPTPTPEVKPAPSPVPSPIAPVVKVAPAPTPTPSPAIDPLPTPQTPLKVEETPKLETQGKESDNASSDSEPMEPPKAIAPASTAQPPEKPVKSPVKDFMSRFRKEPKEKNPVVVPVVPAPSRTAPEEIPSAAPITSPKALDKVLPTDGMEGPQPVTTPQMEAPTIETPKTLTAPGKPEPISTSKPSVPPQDTVSTPTAKAAQSIAPGTPPPVESGLERLTPAAQYYNRVNQEAASPSP